ncbi:MAG: hypothetical protein FJ405_02895 [Verrucomicrobia bacterium]|nr:hypothetical protein [Verrucomicrobiota bacterium]
MILPVALIQSHAADPVVKDSPLPSAHAHNDYVHPRPLLDALDHGFCSVEADIHLSQGQLLIGHDPEDLRPERTLEKLYLAPLAARIQSRGGHVYDKKTEFILLVDIKTEAAATYAVLARELELRKTILTRFTHTAIERGAITVILSGNRPTAIVAAQAERWCAIDGRLPDLERNPPVSLMPLISDNWGLHFKWRGRDAIPISDLELLRKRVSQTHSQGRKLRFWATGDSPKGWALLKAEKVDLIGTDNLSALRSFLLEPK